MNKEQFIALGLTEDQATKAAQASQEELKIFIPKARFDEVNNSLKDLKGQLSDRDKQLKDLGEKAKGNEDLTRQITDLQEANKKAAGDYEAKIRNITLDNAIKLKLKDNKAKYEDLLMSKVDKEKLKIKEDGTIEGLDEQLTSLKEGYKDLFKQPIEGKSPNNNGDSSKDSLANDLRGALAERYSTN